MSTHAARTPALTTAERLAFFEKRRLEHDQQARRDDAAAIGALCAPLKDWVRNSLVERIQFHHKVDGMRELPAEELGQVMTSLLIEDLAASRTKWLAAPRDSDAVPDAPCEVARGRLVTYITYGVGFLQSTWRGPRWRRFDELSGQAQVQFLASLAVAYMGALSDWERVLEARRMDDSGFDEAMSVMGIDDDMLARVGFVRRV